MSFGLLTRHSPQWTCFVASVDFVHGAKRKPDQRPIIDFDRAQ